MAIRSEREALHGGPAEYPWREHKFVGGPPPPRIRSMQSQHEARARKLGVPWDMVDLRVVYRHWKGICGICLNSVSLEEFTIDHIVPLSKGGSHVFENMQPAHLSCNSRKGAKEHGSTLAR